MCWNVCNVTLKNLLQITHRHSIWYSKFIGYLTHAYDDQNIVRLKAFFKEMSYF